MSDWLKTVREWIPTLSEFFMVLALGFLIMIAMLAGSCAPKIPPHLEAYKEALWQCEKRNEMLSQNNLTLNEDRRRCEELLLDGSRLVH